MITNEEKAREISNNCCQWYSEYNSSFTDCAKAALEAMEWKDEQFEQKVELLEFSLRQDFYPYLNEHKIDILEKIIKCFKEL